MQVGPADVADEQRVAGEHEPGLLVATAPVGDDVGVMGGRVPRCRESADDRVAEFDRLTVVQRNVVEGDARPGREVSGRAGRFHERR